MVCVETLMCVGRAKKTYHFSNLGKRKKINTNAVEVKNNLRAVESFYK